MIHIRVDEKLKARASKALEAMGLSLSDAVRVFLTRVAKEKAFPFDLKVPNAETAEAIISARRGKIRSVGSSSRHSRDDFFGVPKGQR